MAPGCRRSLEDDCGALDRDVQCAFRLNLPSWDAERGRHVVALLDHIEAALQLAGDCTTDVPLQRGNITVDLVDPLDEVLFVSEESLFDDLCRRAWFDHDG